VAYRELDLSEGGVDTPPVSFNPEFETEAALHRISETLAKAQSRSGRNKKT
jgi:hypothetical protein